jgi:8-oxo-dGTP pyrophosphatase MutT (NUDIX family)
MKWEFDWGIIGGKVEPGEYSIDAMIREVNEEIGANVDKNKLKFLFFEERPNKIHIPAVHFLYGIILDEKQKIMLNSESEKAEWFEINHLPDKMADSQERILKALNFVKKKIIF